MTTPATPAAPAAATTPQAAPAADATKHCDPPRRHRCCWADDDDWHNSHTRIELAPERHLEAYWHAETLDYGATNPLTRIIERREEFVVRLRVELCGRALEVHLRQLVLQRRLHALRRRTTLQSLGARQPKRV